MKVGGRGAPGRSARDWEPTPPPPNTHTTPRGGSLWDYDGGTPLPSDADFLTLPCDVLVPAALGGVINARTAPRLQCKARGRGRGARGRGRAAHGGG